MPVDVDGLLQDRGRRCARRCAPAPGPDRRPSRTPARCRGSPGSRGTAPGLRSAPRSMPRPAPPTCRGPRPCHGTCARTARSVPLPGRAGAPGRGGRLPRAPGGPPACARADEDPRVPDPVLRREQFLLPRRRDRPVRGHLFYSRLLPLLPGEGRGEGAGSTDNLFTIRTASSALHLSAAAPPPPVSLPSGTSPPRPSGRPPEDDLA